MLAIRMQRLGRKGHPTYRVVVQDVRQTPTSGKYVALLGSYDPHAKTTTLVKEKAEFYLTHGAQPSERVARLFTSEGITLPSWVKQPSDHTRTIRHAEKLRKNQPKEKVVKAEKPAETPATEETAEAAMPEAPPAEVETPEVAMTEAVVETETSEAPEAEETPEIEESKQPEFVEASEETEMPETIESADSAEEADSKPKKS